jgi:hypothetical protein
VRALIARRDELEPRLYWALARDLVEHLERKGDCDEARAELERMTGLDDLDEFTDWITQRPGGACN